MKPLSICPRSWRRPALGVLLVTALICSACGGGSSTTATRPPTKTASHPARKRTTRTVTSATTTVPTTTQTSSSSDLPGDGKPTVTIGDKNDPEQFVLGQLYLQALQAQGFTVNINQNIGPTQVTLHALQNGTLDMYPEYLNTFNSDVAGYRHGFASPQQAYLGAFYYAVRHGLELLTPTPFSDTDAVAVTVAYAQRHRLVSLADLRRVAPALTIGGAAVFRDAPGLPTLARVYDVSPHDFQALALGDQYDDLDDGTVQAAYVQTTDGQLASGDYRLLADPHRIFGYGNVIPVLTTTAAATEGPAFINTINRVDALLSTDTMRELNALTAIANEDPAAVAKQFLQTHGLVPPSSP